MEYIKLVLGSQMNSYLIFSKTSSECAIIDPGFEASRIKNEIESRNLDLKYILLTHGHADHIGAVEELKSYFPESLVLIHEMDREMVETPELNLSPYIQGEEISFSPDKTLENGDIISLTDFEIEVIHLPGHSRGGVGFKIGDDIFIGDSIFRSSIGRTDFYGGDLATLLNSLVTRILSLDDNISLHPGHGPSTTVGLERATNPYLS